MTAAEAPVGIFDSGVGGLSVLGEAIRQLPGENYIYFGDTANAPYGTKPQAEVQRLAFDAVRRLRADGAKAVVIACNTATAEAAKELRATFDLPIIGMEPALKPASAGGVSLRNSAALFCVMKSASARSAEITPSYMRTSS